MTINVYSTLTDPSGNPVPNAVVVATLMGPTLLAGSSVEREVQVFTDVNGLWTLPLIPNPQFSQDSLASWYIIRVGNKEEYRVYVPLTDSGYPNSYEVSTIAYPGIQTDNKSIFIGSIWFQGDMFVAGNLDVSGMITSGSATLVNYTTLPPGTKTTFFNDLQIIGDLKVDGALRYLSITNQT